MSGYSYDKDSYLRRLRRIEGQGRGSGEHHVRPGRTATAGFELKTSGLRVASITIETT